jgi:hypothetical protein
MMSRLILLTLAACSALIVIGQTTSPEVIMEFRGTHPPDSSVLRLMEAEARIFEEHREVAVRDSLRRELLSPGWFYHGMDGMPIDLDGLTARQTRNGFKLIGTKGLREVLYQYESTAILMLHEESTVQDKGETHMARRSTLLVMSKEDGRWVFVADIIGKDPPR